MSYLKRYNCTHKQQRFLNEVKAYRESNLFWTSWLSGWTHPQCIAIYPQQCALRLSMINGRLLSWDDSLILAKKLAETLRQSYGNSGPHLSQRIKSQLWVELANIADYSVTKHITGWVIKLKPTVFRIHGDFKPNNVVITEKDYVVLDWELSRYGILVEDVGSLLAHCLLAELKGQFANFDGVFKVMRHVIPEEICAAFIIADLLRQSARERQIGDALRADFRMNIANYLIKEWFKGR